MLSLFFISAFNNDAYAQRRKKKKKSSKTDQYFDESGFANKLWYGGGVNLGFTGGNNNSSFFFGLSPMVGYKVIDDIVSIGPRAGFQYNNFRVRDFSNSVFKANTWAYNVGVFTRIKAFANFFGQLEYEFENIEFADGTVDPVSNKLNTRRASFDNVYIGAGYNSGGLFGYEFMILYNANQPENTVNTPFEYRVGFTYKY